MEIGSLPLFQVFFIQSKLAKLHLYYCTKQKKEPFLQNLNYSLLPSLSEIFHKKVGNLSKLRLIHCFHTNNDGQTARMWLAMADLTAFCYGHTVIGTDLNTFMNDALEILCSNSKSPVSGIYLGYLVAMYTFENMSHILHIIWSGLRIDTHWFAC